MHRSPTFFSCVAALTLLSAHSVLAASPRITFTAGEVGRISAPVILELPERYAGRKDLALHAIDGESILPLQPIPDDATKFAAMLPELAAGSAKSFRVQSQDGSRDDRASEKGVTVKADSKTITVRVGSQPVLHYNIATVEAPEGIEPLYRRSGYIHPVFDPDGRVVTGDFNPDHPHQHGLFFAWVNTQFDGADVDFWNQHKRTGGVAHGKVLQVWSGPVFGQFRVRLRHFVGADSESKRDALEEIWTVRVYAMPHAQSSGPCLFDLTSEQRCASETPLRINAYHYGGMGVRGSDHWTDPSKAQFLTSQGKGRAEGNHTRPAWVDLSGSIDGQPSGIAVIGHPDNFRHPQPVRLHPSMPYFCFAPSVLGPFEIAPGDTYTSRYRFVVHRGSPDATQLDRIASDYHTSPLVTVEDDVEE